MGIHHYEWPRPSAAEHARQIAELRALRASIADRIEADIAILDALDGDPDLEGEYFTVEADGAGGLHFLGRSTDDEPSLCGSVGVGFEAQQPSTIGGDDREVDTSDDEPWLGSPEQTARVRRIVGIGGFTGSDAEGNQEQWASGTTSDLEDDHDGREPDHDTELENEHGDEADKENWRQPVHMPGGGGDTN